MKKLVLVLMILSICSIGADAFAFIGIDANTVLMLHFNGTDGSTSFADDSFTPHTVIAHGDAQIDTANKKFGSGSGLFDGNGDYLTSPDSVDWSFGSDDFTIDFWVNFTDTSGLQYFYSHGRKDGNSLLWFYTVFQQQLIVMNTYDYGTRLAQYTMEWLPPENVWYHMAFVRSGPTMYWFLNGVNQPLWEDHAIGATAIPDFPSDIYIGTDDVGKVASVTGYLDEFRISKGTARWTSNFTPPTSEYEVIPEPTPLLLLGFSLLGVGAFKRKR
ncbi:LamG domain-containing protein [Candidatus Omnitrophota bacterium]